VTDRPKPRASLPPPILVEDAEGLARLVDEVAGERELAFDTEGDSFFHYEERVCLIQISAAGRDWIVDPLQDFDLAPLGALLADPDITKVFHDGEYDVRILKRNYGFAFAGLFDTRVAAAALGYDAPGLASVVGRWFGIELDKSLQRSNWSRRPLTPSQIDYARLDTHFLIELKRLMLAELESRGRTMVVEGECRRLEALEPGEREFHPDDFLRLKGARGLNLQHMRNLRELFVLRDRLASERDVPPFKVLGNEALLELAQAHPRNMRQLERIQLSPKLIKRFGGQILTALGRAERLGPLPRVPSLPPRDGTPMLDEWQVELLERLKEWRKREAQRQQMDASLILNRHVLTRLALDKPRDEAELRAVEGLLPWQVAMFGRAILEVLAAFEADRAAGRIVPDVRRRNRRGQDRDG
jgi:ribonuclease D